MNLKQSFPMEIKGSFALRSPKGSKPSLLYFVVRLNGKQYKLPTGVKCYPDHWSQQRQQALVSASLTESDNRNNFIVNEKISRFRFLFSDFLKYICEKGIENVSVELLKEKIGMVKRGKETEGIFNYLRKCILEDNVGEGSKGTYQAAINKFEEFVKNERIVLNSFNDITKEVIMRYQAYLCSLTGQKRTDDGRLSANHINHLTKVLLQRLDNYAVKNDKMDKAVLDRAKCYKHLKSKVRTGENAIALRDDEVLALFQYKCKNQEDEDVKNLFCLNCVTGQRISDTHKVDDNVNEIYGVTTIQLKQKKSGAVINVCLLFQMAKDILSLYPDGLPKVSETSINKKIKRIAKEAGIGTELKTISRQSGNDSEPTSTEVRKYDLITTHTGRRTFITMLALRGMSARAIKDYSGHADTRMVEKYCKTDPAKRAVFEKMRRNHPERILKMIGEETTQQPQPIQQPHLVINGEFLDNFKAEAVKCYELEKQVQQQEHTIEQLDALVKQQSQELEMANVFDTDDYSDKVAELALESMYENMKYHNELP